MYLQHTPILIKLLFSIKIILTEKRLEINITELPTGYAGRFFRSAMPFSSHDNGDELFRKIKNEGVSVIVLLAADEECFEKTGRDLRAFYQQEGLEVIHLPIRDFSVPEIASLEGAIAEALKRLRSGSNVLAHCYAGIGRTGTFSACLVKRAFGVGGQEAINWVRERVPGALETPEQIKLVLEF